MWAELIELGGNEIIEDIILEHALNVELRKKGITIEVADTQYEENLLVSLTEIDAATVETILLTKGIGPIRKSKLAWRNAALRKLVGPIDMSDKEIQRMYSVVHGPKYSIQLLVVTTLQEATNAKERIQNGEFFATVALELSIDPSAIHGGIVDPISLADPAWPAPIRETLSRLQPNEISVPIFTGNRWIIVTTDGTIFQPTVSYSEAKVEMRRLALLSQERFKMAQIANSLLENAEVKIFDKQLQRLRPNRQTP
jgi:parvulin-like peptidyl-prolyl isomerase